MKSSSEATGWEQGWDSHERAQRRRLARLTLTEKLQWLEEAHELVRVLAEREQSAAPPDDTSNIVTLTVEVRK